jgi:hypothetical protein
MGHASWIGLEHELAALARGQLFFVGGAPRSGTTWLQLLLDSHPNISCRGEGLFMKHLAAPLDRMIAEWRAGLDDKNRTLFRDAVGYPLPDADDADLPLGAAILRALARQRAGKECLAIGEKTPENVVFFPRLKRLFPAAKFIGIARDPRDVLTSAWHFFQKRPPEADETDAKIAFLRSAFGALNEGARAMLVLGERYPEDCTIVTYERLRADPEAVAARLFRFLGASNEGSIVAACVARSDFAALAGRPAGVARNGAFYRKGVVGDWPSTLTEEMNSMIVAELGWMFPYFGWQA